MSHGNAVVDGYGVELGGIAAHAFYLFLHYLSDFVQMRMSRHKLCERVHHSYHGLSELLPPHAGGDPQCPGSRHASALCTY